MYKIEKRGNEFQRTLQANIYPRNPKEIKYTHWKIKKDKEPGPGTYNNTPIEVLSPRQIIGKDKKVTYMDKHIAKKKKIPSPGLYKNVESGIDKCLSAPLKEFQVERLA